MGNIKEQKFRKIKRSNIGGAVTGMLVLAGIIFLSFATMLAVFGLYIIDAKIRDEHIRISNMADFYRLSESKKSEDILGALDDPKNEYIIIDSKKKL